MTPERFQRIEEVFGKASELEGPARSAYLEQACASDPELLEQVRSLLGVMPTAQNHVAAAIEGGAAMMLPPLAVSGLPGRMLGPYRILETVAGGGMGSVFRAVRDDGQYEKAVAIKLIRDAFALDAFFVQRFVEERQILARMEHPNIARMLDGGVTPDQVPYLVMEFVDGKPITRYAAEQSLSIPARLQLFLQVCGAIHYAHRNLVVHRDIKPGNILVTRDGVVKLLDFGVAKALNSSRDRTQTGLSMITLDYASPEQVRNEPVTTSSDIYSLGLLLYELLAGRAAQKFNDTTNPAEIMRVICELDPVLPSVASGDRSLAGDLDNIVMKAVRKDPAARYGSAEELAADIRRLEAGLPVQARPGTLGYLAGKFVRRNKGAVVLASSVLGALILGGVLTLRQARIAERRFDLVRDLAHSIVFEVDPALEQVTGATPARRIIIDRASAYLDKLSIDSEGDAGLQLELAAAFEKLAGVQGNPNLSNLGDLPGAIASYEKAQRIRQQLLLAKPNDAENKSLLAVTKAAIGSLQSERGNTKEGRELLQQAVAECKGIEFTSATVARRIANAHLRLAQVTSSRSNIRASFDLYRTGIAILEEAARRFPNEDFRSDLSLLYTAFARALREASDLPRALEAAQKALELRLAAMQSNESPEHRRNLAQTHMVMADVLGAPGQFSLNRTAEAKLHYEKGLAIAEEIALADPKSYRAQRDRMVFLNRLGDVVERMGDNSTALAMYQKALSIVEALEANDHRPPIRLDLASALARVGDRYLDMGRREAGMAMNERALRIRQSVVEADPANAEAKRHFMLSGASLGDELRKGGKLEQAERLLRQALAMAESLAKADPADALSNRYVAVTSEMVGGVLFAQKRYTEACPHYEHALEVILRVNAAGVAVDSDAEGIAVLRRELDDCRKKVTANPPLRQ